MQRGLGAGSNVGAVSQLNPLWVLDLAGFSQRGALGDVADFPARPGHPQRLALHEGPNVDGCCIIIWIVCLFGGILI